MLSPLSDKKKSRKLDRERRHRMEDSRSSGDDNSRDMIPPPLTAKEDSGSDGDSPPSRPILMDVPGIQRLISTPFLQSGFLLHLGFCHSVWVF